MNILRKIILSLFLIFLALSAVAVVTGAYLLDTGTSEGNTLASGTLDLNVDGGDTNVVKFNVSNIKPGSQPKGTYTLKNVGTLNGYLDLENISVEGTENSCNDPETKAGDTTCGNPGSGEGELEDVVNLRLFVDKGCDGWISTGDNVFYNGLAGSVASSYDLNEQINAGSTTCIVALFDWWSTPDDNKAQGDAMDIDMTFELAQTTSQ